MCICVDCQYVDRCESYHAVEKQHQQPHLTHNPTFVATNPRINVHIRNHGQDIEWDVVACDSFQEERGRWAQLRPGQAIPT